MRKDNKDKTLKDKTLNEITRFYLSSGDFNGIPARTLIANLGLKWTDIIEVLKELIEIEKISILFSDAHINTHIMRLGYEDKEVQIAKLKTNDMLHTCIYPLPKHLQKIVDKSQYTGKPYLLSLALGSPQLAYRAFDLSILEFYRNDPRYYYIIM